MFKADDVCLARETSNPEKLDSISAGKTGVKVTLKPCVRKLPDMPKNDTILSANQMWTKRIYKWEVPRDPKQKGMARKKHKTFYTLTVPDKWLIKAGMVKPSADYVAQDNQEWCLTAKIDSTSGKPKSELTVQTCEFKKKT